MAHVQSVLTVSPAVARDAWWPVWIAPLVASAYYLSLQGAFAFSIDGVVFDASDVDVTDLLAPRWGSHWIYHSFAEAVSLAFGLFVAAGIARQRARAASIIGALAISIVYLLQNASWIYFVYLANSRWESIEPWYQHVVAAAVIVGAPFIGFAVSGSALELNGPATVGFAGINRLHFIWLWFAAGSYASGVLVPLMYLCRYAFVDSYEENRISLLLHTIVFGLPVAAYGLPLIWGLVALAGEFRWSRAVNNVVGPAILVVGWPIAASIQFFWVKVISSVFG
jgi:hypothetical protein